MWRSVLIALYALGAVPFALGIWLQLTVVTQGVTAAAAIMGRQPFVSLARGPLSTYLFYASLVVMVTALATKRTKFWLGYPLSACDQKFGQVLYGYLLGLFPVNVLHSLVHLAIGIWGVVAWRRITNPKFFARALAVFYGLLAVLGLIPGVNTLFGLLPIHGHDVWLHALLAGVAAWFGWARLPEEKAATVARQSCGSGIELEAAAFGSDGGAQRIPREHEFGGGAVERGNRLAGAAFLARPEDLEDGLGRGEVACRGDILDERFDVGAQELRRSVADVADEMKVPGMAVRGLEPGAAFAKVEKMKVDPLLVPSARDKSKTDLLER